MKRLICLVVLVGCTSSDDPAKLDHAQILAVRSEPAHVAPGGSVRIDVLASDTAGDVFVAVPDAVTVGALTAVRGGDGWYVTAPAQPGSPMASITIAIDATELTAQKQLVFADDAPNPTVTPTPAAIACDHGTTPALGATSDAVEPASYAWYTSIGKLEHYRRADAQLDATDAGDGTLVVVVRDAQGGVGWQVVPASVR